MRQSIQHNNITWIDIKDPNSQDVEFLRDNFKFHDFVLEELVKPSHRQKVENYDDYLFMMLYYPVFDASKKEVSEQELDILITKSHLITAHYQVISPLDNFFDNINSKNEAREKYMSETAGHLLFYVIHKILEDISVKITVIEEQVRQIEKEIFKGREKEMVFEISRAKRDIIDYRRIVGPQISAIESLQVEGTKFFGESLEPHLTDLRGSFSILWNNLLDQRETIQALGETNESLLSTKTNEVIKVLTVFSVIFLPITLIANIFGMNLDYFPLSRTAIDFWAIVGIMTWIAIAMFIYFKRQKWL